MMYQFRVEEKKQSKVRFRESFSAPDGTGTHEVFDPLLV